MELKQRRIDSTIEKRIITGMIVSERYLQEIIDLTDLSYFQNEFTRKIASWCIDFYKAYRTSPFNDIQSIFERETESVKPEEAEIINKLLQDIGDNFEIDKGINVEFLVDQTLDFFKKRELQITAGNIQILLERNQIEKAEDEIIKFRKLSKITSGWSNPLDDEEIDATFDKQENPLITFPGPLGVFLGPLQKTWLVGITGPYKRGKTWLLEELLIQCALSRKKSVVISLEMPKWQVNHRLYKRLTRLGDSAGNYLMPCFDCLRNQLGSCNMEGRTNTHSLMREGEDIPYPDNYAQFVSLNYRPCTSCKDNWDPSSRNPTVRNMIQEYSQSSWYTIKKLEGITRFDVKEKMKAVRRMFGNYIRIKAYPRNSASVNDIIRDLDILEQTENFVPEVIGVDYADILKADNNTLTGYSKEDDVWMNLARLAGERQALVFAPTQATGDALEVENVTQKHTARWKGKLGHVDAMYSLNQTEEEKARGVMRIGIMAHRHQEFMQMETCTILQQLALGQVNLGAFGARSGEGNAILKIR